MRRGGCGDGGGGNGTGGDITEAESGRGGGGVGGDSDDRSGGDSLLGSAPAGSCARASVVPRSVAGLVAATCSKSNQPARPRKSAQQRATTAMPAATSRRDGRGGSAYTAWPACSAASSMVAPVGTETKPEGDFDQKPEADVRLLRRPSSKRWSLAAGSSSRSSESGSGRMGSGTGSGCVSRTSDGSDMAAPSSACKASARSSCLSVHPSWLMPPSAMVRFSSLMDISPTRSCIATAWAGQRARPVLAAAFYRRLSERRRAPDLHQARSHRPRRPRRRMQSDRSIQVLEAIILHT